MQYLESVNMKAVPRIFNFTLNKIILVNFYVVTHGRLCVNSVSPFLRNI